MEQRNQTITENKNNTSSILGTLFTLLLFIFFFGIGVFSGWQIWKDDESKDENGNSSSPYPLNFTPSPEENEVYPICATSCPVSNKVPITQCPISTSCPIPTTPEPITHCPYYPTNTPSPVITQTPCPIIKCTSCPTLTSSPISTATPCPVITGTPCPVITQTPCPVITCPTITPSPVITATPCPVITGTPCPVITQTPCPVITCPTITPCPEITTTPCPVINCPTSAPCPSCISPKIARYVLLERTNFTVNTGGESVINISEIEVYDQNGIKFPSSTITASLGPPYRDSGWDASKLLDTIFSDSGTSHTDTKSPTTNPFMQLDLGSDKQISKVIVYNRFSSSFCCQSRIKGCSLILKKEDNTETFREEIMDEKMMYVFIACSEPEVQIYFDNIPGCLDSSAFNSGGLGRNSCNISNFNQKFKLIPKANDKSKFQIFSESNRQCLSSSSTSPWVFQNCDATNNAQFFEFQKDTSNNQRVIKSSSFSTNCLDVGNSNRFSTCSTSNNNQKMFTNILGF